MDLVVLIYILLLDYWFDKSYIATEMKAVDFHIWTLNVDSSFIKNIVISQIIS